MQPLRGKPTVGKKINSWYNRAENIFFLQYIRKIVWCDFIGGSKNSMHTTFHSSQPPVWTEEEHLIKNIIKRTDIVQSSWEQMGLISCYSAEIWSY